MTNVFVRACAALALLVLPLGLSSIPAWAHEGRDVAGHRITVGWVEEPAFAGVPNAVDFRVAEPDGRGVEGLQMKVEVLFGDKDATQKVSFDLEPAFGEPGSYEAALIPTRAGKFTFHISGQLDAAPFDQFFTSGENTFDDIHEPKEVQFPAKDPSAGELAELSQRLSSRAEAADRAADAANKEASNARNLAIGGIGAAVIALILGIAALIFGRRRGVT
jgi:hypothetical protein